MHHLGHLLLGKVVIVGAFEAEVWGNLEVVWEAQDGQKYRTRTRLGSCAAELHGPDAIRSGIAECETKGTHTKCVIILSKAVLNHLIILQSGERAAEIPLQNVPVLRCLQPEGIGELCLDDGRGWE